MKLVVLFLSHPATCPVLSSHRWLLLDSEAEGKTEEGPDHWAPSELPPVSSRFVTVEGRKGIWGEAPGCSLTSTKLAPLLSASLIDSTNKIQLEESVPVFTFL